MPKISDDRSDLVFGSTKKWSAVSSTAFRQHLATSHCNVNHGYALTFEATFETRHLDHRNWVVDFGSLKDFKGWLEYMFDHTTLVATDDPHVELFKAMHNQKVMNVRLVDAVGCEAIALLAFESLERWLSDHCYTPRVSLVKLQVWEHDGNSAYVRLARVHNGD